MNKLTSNIGQDVVNQVGQKAVVEEISELGGEFIDNFGGGNQGGWSEKVSLADALEPTGDMTGEEWRNELDWTLLEVL